MKASQVIEKLRTLMEQMGGDPEVFAQSAGCCQHGHEIVVIEAGGKTSIDPRITSKTDWPDEAGAIVIRV